MDAQLQSGHLESYSLIWLVVTFLLKKTMKSAELNSISAMVCHIHWKIWFSRCSRWNPSTDWRLKTFLIIPGWGRVKQTMVARRSSALDILWIAWTIAHTAAPTLAMRTSTRHRHANAQYRTPQTVSFTIVQVMLFHKHYPVSNCSQTHKIPIHQTLVLRMEKLENVCSSL